MTVICLCGSTRFTREMLVREWELTKQGHVVLTWCIVPNATGDHLAEKEEIHNIVDEVHRRKIDLADEVLVLNIGGYIGDSTRSEIEYAKANGKTVRYLEGTQ